MQSLHKTDMYFEDKKNRRSEIGNFHIHIHKYINYKSTAAKSVCLCV